MRARLIALVIVLLALSIPGHADAAPLTPLIAWTPSSLAPNSSVQLSTLVTSNSQGTKRWSVRGSCSIIGTRLVTKSSGSCSVTLRIDASRGFTARTSLKTLPIKKDKPVTYDPYAGTIQGSTPTGTKSTATVMTPDGRTRRYRTYVPSTLPNSPVPLLIGLHGGLGTSAQFEANSGFNNLAESNGFIVAYPDGIGNRPDGSGFQTWNGGYCCGPAQSQQVDDVEFISRLIDQMSARFTIDPKRVYVAGHSNGGILGYQLACRLSHKISAVGVQAGSNVVEKCTPSQPVSFIHVHGTADTNMPIGGGRGSGISPTIFVPARSAVDAMVSAVGATSTPVTGVVASNADITALTWTRVGTNTQVRYVTVATATHAWMGHPSQSSAGESYAGKPYENFDSSRAIWSFLSAHPRQ
jgi:polyhydroxybutyrate depolymerase